MHTTRKLAALAAGLMLSATALADAPAPLVPETNLGPTLIGAQETSIFGETPEERRRNQTLAIAGVAAAILIGIAVTDDDDDDAVVPEHTPPR